MPNGNSTLSTLGGTVHAKWLSKLNKTYNVQYKLPNDHIPYKIYHSEVSWRLFDSRESHVCHCKLEIYWRIVNVNISPY